MKKGSLFIIFLLIAFSAFTQGISTEKIPSGSDSVKVTPFINDRGNIEVSEHQFRMTSSIFVDRDRQQVIIDTLNSIINTCTTKNAVKDSIIVEKTNESRFKDTQITNKDIIIDAQGKKISSLTKLNWVLGGATVVVTVLGIIF